jgi:SAM-dependent methyltransferase
LNLADLLRRGDRCVSITSGEIEPGEWKGPKGTERVVRFHNNAVLVLRNAHEFSVLKGFPIALNWTLIKEDRTAGALIVEIMDAAQLTRRHELAKVEFSGDETRVPINFNWPIWAGARSGFHLMLRQLGGKRSMLAFGPLFNPRRHILPLMKGSGVEVGPGLNPHVLPRKDVEVRYVETLSGEQWVKLYKKTDKPPRAVTDNLWANYITGSAHTLDVCGDESLDFIYSNHVFEHLANPLGVMSNWLRKLKPSGLIAGVVPDLRYTFDLRQPSSTVEDFKRERECGSYDIPRTRYEQWCRFTAPYNTPEDLIARKYSIHAHYYTPDRFAELIAILREEGLVHSAFLDTAPNNKDFGFLIWKQEPNA